MPKHQCSCLEMFIESVQIKSGLQKIQFCLANPTDLKLKDYYYFAYFKLPKQKAHISPHICIPAQCVVCVHNWHDLCFCSKPAVI